MESQFQEIELVYKVRVVVNKKSARSFASQFKLHLDQANSPVEGVLFGESAFEVKLIQPTEETK